MESGKGKSLWTVLLIFIIGFFVSFDGAEQREDRKNEQFGREGRPGRNPGNHWAISFGERTGSNYATSILKTDDGGYLITGHLTYTQGPDGWVYKFSENGDLEWANKLGWLCGCSCQTKDGGYILAGKTIIKLSRSGQVEWLKLAISVDDSYFQSVQQTEDGGYILIGRISWPDPVEFNSAECILKLDEHGEVEWAKKFGTRHGGYNSILQTQDGGFVAMGNYEGSIEYFWIMKLSFQGEIEWQEKLGRARRDYASCLSPTSDGGFIVAGQTSSFGAGGEDVWILKLVPSGAIDWQKTYGGPGDDSWGKIIQTKGGGYIMTGTSRNNNSGDCLIFKLSAQGEIGWVRTFGEQDYPYQSDEEAAGVCQAADGGFAIIGSTDRLGVESPGVRWPNRNILLIKLSRDGNIGSCGFLGRVKISIGKTYIVPTPLNYVMNPIDLKLGKIDWSPSPATVKLRFLCD